MNFLGYRRPDGSVGTRNIVVVLPTIGCANEIANRIAKAVPQSCAMPHNHACIRLGKDSLRARDTLIGIGRNPNIAAVLLVGLGCEPIKAEELQKEIGKTGKPTMRVVLEELGDYDTVVREGIRAAQILCGQAMCLRREPCSLSDLTIGIKCGGSGAVSAVSSNPAVGMAADMLIQQGGKVIFTETAELIGAEHVLAKRGVTPQVSRDLLDVVADLKAEIARYGVDLLGSEPTQGNIRNGLTTIEEKSLGAIVKGGTMPLSGVLRYAQKPALPGLYFMDGTTQASQLFLGMFAAGAQIQVFSMGGGLPAKIRGLPSYPPGFTALPVLKVLGSCDDEAEKPYFDVYAGDILKGSESIQQVGKRIFDTIIATASGQETCTDQQGDYREMLQFYANGLLM